MKSKFFSVFLALFVLLTSACTYTPAGASSGGGNGQEGEQSRKDASGTQTADVTPPAENGEPTEDGDSSVDNDEESDDRIIGLSDTMHAQNFDIEIVSTELCNSIETEAGLKYEAEEGTVFLCVMFKATNTTDDTKNVEYIGFNSYVDKEKVGMEAVLGKVDGNFPLMGAVSAGMSFTGYTVWKLPEDWGEFQFSYIDAGLGGESEQSFHFTRAEVE